MAFCFATCGYMYVHEKLEYGFILNEFRNVNEKKILFRFLKIIKLSDIITIGI